MLRRFTRAANGRGVLVFANGNRYEGNWVDDSRSGLGVFTCATSGYIYEGSFNNGRRHGVGRIVLPNGDSFKGRFEEGKIVGPVEWKFANDSVWNNVDY